MAADEINDQLSRILGGANTRPLPSSEPGLGDAAAGRFASDELAYRKGAAEMAAMFAGEIASQSAKEIVAAIGDLKNDLRAILTGTTASPTAAGGVPIPGVDIAPGTGPGAAASQQRTDTTTSSAPTEGGNQRKPPPNPKEEYEAARHHPITGIQKRIGGRLQEALSSAAPRVDDIEGDPDNIRVTTREGIETIIARDSDEGRSVLRNSARVARVGGALGKLSAGEGMAGALGSFGSVARVAGPIGIGVGLIQQGANKLEDQYNAQAQYKSAFGDDDTGMFAAKERLGSFTARLSGWGTIGGDRAVEQYERATALGLRGERRTEAMDFATDMFKSLGVDTAEAMEIVQRTTRNTQLSLGAFAQGMKEVSKAAVEAGRSAKDARDQFLGTQAGLVQAGVGSTGSIYSAEFITSVAQGFGGGLDGSDYTGFLSDRSLQLQAANSGMSYSDLLAKRASGQADVLGGAIVGGMSQIADMILASWGVTRDAAKGAIQSVTGADQKIPSADQNEAILNAIKKAGSGAASIITVRSAFKAYGMEGKTDEDMLRMLWINLLGIDEGFASESQVIQRKDDKKYQKWYGKSLDRDWNDTVPLIGDGGDLVQMAQDLGLLEEKGFVDELKDGVGPYDQKPVLTGVEEDYLNDVADNRGGYTQLDRLFGENEDEFLKEAGAKNLDEAKIYVKDPSGKMVPMNLRDALKNEDYKNQILAGSAHVGSEGGKTISEITNITGSPVNSTDGTDTGGTSTTRVEVVPGPELREWFKFNNVSNSDRNGTPPPATPSGG